MALRPLTARQDLSAGSSEALGARLLRTLPPYEAPLGRKQRVARRLADVRGRRVPVLLRPAMVMGIVLGGGAIASAALWHWPQWVVRRYERLTEPAAVASAPAASAGHARRRAPGRPGQKLVAAGVAPEAVDAIVDAPSPVPSPFGSTDSAAGLPASPEPRTRAMHRHEAPSASVARAHASAGSHTVGAEARRAAARSDDDTAFVLAAVRALRRQHDPVEARRLLGAYLERNPRGALAEEALAVSIEAAVENRDADAATLASRYLRLYPNGPFRALARHTLSSLRP